MYREMSRVFNWPGHGEQSGANRQIGGKEGANRRDKVLFCTRKRGRE